MIILPGQLENVTSRKDRTLKLTIGTQELSPADAGKVMAMANSYCFFSIKPEDFTVTEKEILAQLKADQLTNTGKTPSQRLRSTLYVLFTQNPEGFTKFDLFYTHKIEQMIGHFKSKLQP